MPARARADINDNVQTHLHGTPKVDHQGVGQGAVSGTHTKGQSHTKGQRHTEEMTYRHTGSPPSHRHTGSETHRHTRKPCITNRIGSCAQDEGRTLISIAEPRQTTTAHPPETLAEASAPSHISPPWPTPDISYLPNAHTHPHTATSKHSPCSGNVSMVVMICARSVCE
jgi:hypothetical protein